VPFDVAIVPGPIAAAVSGSACIALAEPVATCTVPIVVAGDGDGDGAGDGAAEASAARTSA
jgi:hypothetical protein